MSAYITLAVVLGYFLVLILISKLTTRKGNHDTFFLANRQSPWYVVAFGMVGTTLSGVTFISVPGWVGDTQFSYFQMVLGYIVGYMVIAHVLMPLYYRLNLTSIYTYLEDRFGFWSYKTGAFYFLLSRTIGASFRLYLVALVFQVFILDQWELDFYLAVLFSLALILVYTYKGGIKTIVWTDMLQTFFLVSAMLLSIVYLTGNLDFGGAGAFQAVVDSDYSKAFFWDLQSPEFFVKSFIAGAFMAIVMTGLDQDMMQKNLSCPNIWDAQKNMYFFTITLVIVKTLFLFLGALIYMYASQYGIEIPSDTDRLYPKLAFEHFPMVAAIVFLLGLTAAAYSSADSALTALTTSFCVDFLNFKKQQESAPLKTRYIVHGVFTFIIFLLIMLFYYLLDMAVIHMVFQVAIYTYGPLLGLYAYGLLTRMNTMDKMVPVVCILAPIITFAVDYYTPIITGGYEFGFELVIFNGGITFAGLWLLKLLKKD